MRFLLYSWLLFLIVLLSILSDADKNSVYGQCLSDQRVLLLQLNQSFNFSRLKTSVSSSKLSSWNSNTDCCTAWGGVNCDKDGQVIGLDLSSEFISGGLDNSSSLFKLQHLQNLNLAYNSFNSTTQIPSGFDLLVNLTNLNMSNSGFTGQIPIGISRLTRLVSLDLSFFLPGRSSLKLDDPDFRTLIGNLSELRVLHLDGVNISAAGRKWCQDLSSSLPKLQVLSLSNCQLSGPFDQSLTKLESLYEIRLDQNNISAPVPDFFANFTNLTSLHLTSCGLNGKFPEKILQLQKLQSLHLAENPLLHGCLPELHQNGSLQTLVLSNTDFNGELPDSIGNLKLLSHLDLVNCGFNGSIPSSIANLDQLQYLDLSLNRFIGTIPSSPTGWSDHLTQINLAHNRLTGPIPPHWNRLVKLFNLNLRNNSLNGLISPTLFTLPSLQKLDLSQNQFRGQLGEFTNKSTPLLETLDLSSNKLEGPIPTSIFELSSSLIVLTLSSNKFNGTLSLDMFQKFKNLSRLDLSGNNLSISSTSTGGGGANSALFPQVGTLNLRSCNLRVFPEFLRNQSKLNHLDLSNNQISGKIPNWVSVIGNGNLNHLNLSNNRLEDPEQPFPFPDPNFKSLAVLDLHSNMLQGQNFILPPSAIFLDYSNNKLNSTVPPTIGSYLSITIFFSLSNNALVGEIPTSVCQAKYLQVLDLSNNSLSGTIPECLVSIPGLSVLNLRGNNFSGAMPQTISGPCSLRTLDLNGNRLEGQIPKSMAICKMIEVLDLGNNQLSGTFPYWLGNLTHLRVLVLRFNKFYGSVGRRQQTDDSQFPKLQIIDISSNNFSGELTSECFLSWKAMMINKEEDHSDYKSKILRFGFLELSQLYYEDAVTVASKGLDMELVKILTIYTSIDLSNNGFEGEIPDVIGNLSSLYILNLSRNALTGRIPSSMGKLSQLESLDLSKNQLTGEIPVELANLSFLSFLNLSTNKLVGKIPLGTQIQSFNATSFEGNDRLCGPPLPKNCSDILKEESPAVGLKSNKIDFDWQFIVTGIGFGGGVGIVFGPLLFWKRWMKWYNEQIISLLLIILPAGYVHIACDDDDVRIDADEEGMGEELMEMMNNDGLEEEDEEVCHGRFCVFCTKLDSTMTIAIHDPNCSCHLESSNSSSSSF